jgi:hypothetical protein
VRAEHSAVKGPTVVLEPFLSPVACAGVQSEFVDNVWKDLGEQRLLNALYCFPVLKIEAGQSVVVSADGLVEGAGQHAGRDFRDQDDMIGSLITIHDGLALAAARLGHRTQRRI